MSAFHNVDRLFRVDNSRMRWPSGPAGLGTKLPVYTLPVKNGNIWEYEFKGNPTTWRLASMNMAIRGMDFDFGKEPANTFSRDEHPDLCADYIMANSSLKVRNETNCMG